MITRRLASTATGSNSSPRKIVLVGAGFLGELLFQLVKVPYAQPYSMDPGSYVARALIADPRNRVLLVSRDPKPCRFPFQLFSSYVTFLTPEPPLSSIRPAFSPRLSNPPTSFRRHHLFRPTCAPTSYDRRFSRGLHGWSTRRLPETVLRGRGEGRRERGPRCQGSWSWKDGHDQCDRVGSQWAYPIVSALVQCSWTGVCVLWEM